MNDTMEYQCTPREEIQSRITRFQKSLQDSDIAGALISQNVDLFYFAGTIQRSFLFVPAEGEAVLAVQGNLGRAQRESSLSQVVPLKNSQQLAQVLSDFHYSLRGRIGLEMDVLPVRYYLALRRGCPEADFLDISELVRKVRMVKSEYEISQIRKACEILNLVMLQAQTSIRPGMTELEVDALLVASARRMGHQGLLRMRGYNQEMFSAHVFCGKTATVSPTMNVPLGGLGTTPAIAQGASFNVISENQPLIIDFGVGINGYVTDMTRTFVIGKLPQKLKQAYSVAKEIKDFMEQWVTPGRSWSQLYEEAWELARRMGYRDHFMGYKGHQVAFVGHGIGLEIDEYPVIAPGFDEEFRENMVFALEPKLVFPDVGAVGVEDDYLVTETGMERLTTYSDQVLTIDWPGRPAQVA
ncbi:MAG: Xaa-Pro peptidase family protein [Dehalococcoidia bacterium]|jgi:Xaa-Pro dipeptidase